MRDCKHIRRGAPPRKQVGRRNKKTLTSKKCHASRRRREGGKDVVFFSSPSGNHDRPVLLFEPNTFHSHQHHPPFLSSALAETRDRNGSTARPVFPRKSLRQDASQAGTTSLCATVPPTSTSRLPRRTFDQAMALLKKRGKRRLLDAGTTAKNRGYTRAFPALCRRSGLPSTAEG